jgi:hypothetical protein
VIAVAAIVLGGLLALARPTASVEDPRFARLQAGLRRVTETSAGLTVSRRWRRSRSYGDHGDDPSEVERVVREQLYGRSALRAERGPAGRAGAELQVSGGEAPESAAGGVDAPGGGAGAPRDNASSELAA